MAATANGSVRSSSVSSILINILKVLIYLQARGNISVLGDTVDTETFDQILEMDDDDDRDFSKEIVYGFLDQAETTFVKMQDAMYVLTRISTVNLSTVATPLKSSYSIMYSPC